MTEMAPPGGSGTAGGSAPGGAAFGSMETPGGGTPFLRRDESGLFLTDGRLELRGDFTQLLPRLRPDRLHGELLVRAAKVKKGGERAADGGATAVEAAPRHSSAFAAAETAARRPLAVDATAGLGEDALLLAAAGFSVRLYEYDPVIAALLEDALLRAEAHPALTEIVRRMQLFREDSIAALPNLPETPDVVLLDPMFPAREKSALVKKKFQLLQRLERPCFNEAELLQAAMAARPRKIVIKRPLKGAYLAGVKPDYSLTGKAIRYDCLVLPENR